MTHQVPIFYDWWKWLVQSNWLIWVNNLDTPDYKERAKSVCVDTIKQVNNPLQYKIEHNNWNEWHVNAWSLVSRACLHLCSGSRGQHRSPVETSGGGWHECGPTRHGHVHFPSSGKLDRSCQNAGKFCLEMIQVKLRVPQFS